MLAHPALRPVLAELTPEHFYDPLHRAACARTSSTGAELDASGRRAARGARRPRGARGIDESTGTELLLRLRERELQRELASTPIRAGVRELQEALQRLLEKVAALSSACVDRASNGR